MQGFDKLAEILNTGRSLLFEGQMRLAFMGEGLEASRIVRSHIFLIDCDNATRAGRLNLNRLLPEPAYERMMGRADYLRGEFLEAGCETILDTGKMSLDACVEQIYPCLEEPNLQ